MKSNYLNGHSFIERELSRAKIGFRNNDNAFLAVDDPGALQAAAERLSPEIIRERLDYWTLVLGPKFSAKQRKQMNLRRCYAVSQTKVALRRVPAVPSSELTYESSLRAVKKSLEA